MKKILVILDGAADLPLDLFGEKTPLEVAETPNLDFFAKNGKLGYMYPINEHTIPGSDNALISIFGNNPKLCRRGVYEAIGAGFELKRGDLALRTNFGTIENLKTKIVIDRRAGRTLTTKEAQILADSINQKVKLPCKFEFKSTIQHRGVLVFRGGFSDNISNIDTEWTNPGKKVASFEFSKPNEDDELSKHTANILNEFVTQSFKILNLHPINLKRKERGFFPANMIFTRGSGIEIPKIKPYKSWMSINSMPLEVGIAKLSKMKNFSHKIPELKTIDIYKHLYKTLNQKIKFSIKTLKKNHEDFLGCYIHFKETDIPGHDNKPYEKKNIIETIDKKFFGPLKKLALKNNWKVVVTCDHSTPCKLKAHSSHPVPVLVYDGKEKDKAHRFNEVESRIGSLKKFYGKDFMDITELNK